MSIFFNEIGRMSKEQGENINIIHLKDKVSFQEALTDTKSSASMCVWMSSFPSYGQESKSHFFGALGAAVSQPWKGCHGLLPPLGRVAHVGKRCS